MEKVAMERRACPHLGGKKCIGEKCAAWDEGPITEKTAGGPVEKWAAGCVEYFWGPVWQREMTMRLHGIQSTLESARNNEASGMKFIAGIVQDAAQRRRLINGS